MKMTDIALAQARAKAIRAPQQAPTEQIGYTTKLVVEPNEKGQKRIDEERQAAIARGDNPPEAFQLAVDERGDVVVYHCLRVIRATTPSGLALPQGSEAVIDVVGDEIYRRPYSEVQEVVREAFGETIKAG